MGLIHFTNHESRKVSHKNGRRPALTRRSKELVPTGFPEEIRMCFSVTEPTNKMTSRTAILDGDTDRRHAGSRLPLHLTAEEMRLLLVTLCAAPSAEIEDLIQRIADHYHNHAADRENGPVFATI